MQELTKKLLAVLAIFCFAETSLAQLPVCSGPGSGLIYMIQNGQIYNYNPTAPVLIGVNPVLNTIPGPPINGTLAVCNNINGPGPSPTFYCVVGQNYHYYDGTSWVNTGHTAGAVNPCGAGNFLYSLGGSTIYKYDGTGNANFLTTLAGFVGVADLQGDNAGNFYALSTGMPNQWLKKFDPSGNPIQTWTLSGAPNGGGGGGISIVGSTLAYTQTSSSTLNNTLYQGTIGPTNVAISTVASPFFLSPGDHAACSQAVNCLVEANIDTAYQCPGAAPIAISALGTGTYTWTVVSGFATIIGSGTNITVNATTSSIIRLSTTQCPDSADTVHIIVPTLQLSAGMDDSVEACGSNYTRTLAASYSNSTPGIVYSIDWQPATNIVNGANTLNPIVNITGPTDFVITVSIPASQGGCSWKDTVHLDIKDVSVTPAFSYQIRYGCTEDTVYFTNQSTNSTSSKWTFGNGSGGIATNPIYIYKSQGIYTVQLLATNAKCSDSISQTIDLNHPLDASFTVDDDSVCLGQLLTFANTSTTTTRLGIGPTYFWDFGDGNTSNNINPTHSYNQAGVFRVTMVVTDFVPCTDTAYKTIVVDTVSFANILMSDTSLCEGDALRFVAEFPKNSSLGYTWNFGDGTDFSNTNPITHAYDTSGVFTVKFTVTNRICPDTSDEITVTVKPQPNIDLGMDTTICPNASPLVLRDNINASNPAAIWLWNTGDSSSSIKVRHEGDYTARVTIDGCSNRDSVSILKDCYVDIPNAFTPNEDGTDDYFLPRQLLSRGVNRFSMMIFNRWGEKVFETTRIDGRGWDGRFGGEPQPLGVYVYVIEATFKNNITEKYQGNVTLLR